MNDVARFPDANTRTPIKAAMACACGLALAACVAPIPQAHAATADTMVTIVADNNRISITAPLRVDMVVTADGTFIAPDAANTRIQNQSIFGVHVSNIEVTPAEGHTIVTQTQFASAQETNALWMGIAPNGKTAVQAGDHLGGSAPSAPSDWNMTKAGGSSPDIELDFSGAMKNIENPTTDATKAYDITWTFAVGNK